MQPVQSHSDSSIWPSIALVTHKMPLDLDIQKDLHEAFRLLYDDEEDFNFDADWDEDDDAIRLPEEEEAQVEPEIRSTKYSKVCTHASFPAHNSS